MDSIYEWIIGDLHSKQNYTFDAYKTTWIEEKQPIITELWVVYGYNFFFLHIQDPYILNILQAPHIQPVSRLQLILSNDH